MSLGLRAEASGSTSHTLLPAFRRKLEGHFGCPVVDVYGAFEQADEHAPPAQRRAAAVRDPHVGAQAHDRRRSQIELRIAT